MDDEKKAIIEIRQGLVKQFILAAGQFVGEKEEMEVNEEIVKQWLHICNSNLLLRI